MLSALLTVVTPVGAIGVNPGTLWAAARIPSFWEVSGHRPRLTLKGSGFRSALLLQRVQVLCVLHSS